MVRSFGNALSLEEIEMGRDLLLVITGGDAHIGAVSTAYLKESSPSGFEVETSSVPGHKEHVLTETFALTCALQLRRTVTVVMGIHFDHLQRQELDELINEVKHKLDVFLEGKKKSLSNSKDNLE